MSQFKRLLEMIQGHSSEPPKSLDPMEALSRGAHVVDNYTGKPLRAAALAALQEKNPIEAAKSAFGSDDDVSGQQVAHEFLRHAEEAGMPLRAPGQKEYWSEKPVGAAVEAGLDASNLLPMAPAEKILSKAAELRPLSRLKAMLEGGREDASLAKMINPDIYRMQQFGEDTGALKKMEDGMSPIDPDDLARSIEENKAKADEQMRRQLTSEMEQGNKVEQSKVKDEATAPLATESENPYSSIKAMLRKKASGE